MFVASSPSVVDRVCKKSDVLNVSIVPSTTRMVCTARADSKSKGGGNAGGGGKGEGGEAGAGT